MNRPGGKRSENSPALQLSRITITFLSYISLSVPAEGRRGSCWSWSILMRRTVCLSVWERESCLFAGKLSVCAAAETSTPPTLHNLVSGPPLINFTAAFLENLWSDAGVDRPRITTAVCARKHYTSDAYAKKSMQIHILALFCFRKGRLPCAFYNWLSTFMPFNRNSSHEVTAFIICLEMKHKEITFRQDGWY